MPSNVAPGAAPGPPVGASCRLVVPVVRMSWSRADMAPPAWCSLSRSRRPPPVRRRGSKFAAATPNTDPLPMLLLSLGRAVGSGCWRWVVEGQGAHEDVGTSGFESDNKKIHL